MNKVLHVCAFKDNYIWLILDAAERYVVIVDPGDADPVFEAIAAHRWTPVAILCTHHHGDHVGGVAALTQHFAVPVYGPKGESISTVTHKLQEGDTVNLSELDLRLSVVDVPGHTSGHIAYCGAGLLFCGDTLFSAGCGRLFEGTAAQLHHSLSKLAHLPDETKVYCAHEYTAANLRFALTVEPGNQDIAQAQREVKERRAHHVPSLPSNIGRERLINPFLRVTKATVRDAVQRHVGRNLGRELDVFAELRKWKDDFRG